MDYIIEDDKLYRITENGSKEQLLFVTDNGRLGAIVVEISPIRDNWLNECKEYGIIQHTDNEPTPFWNNEQDKNETLRKAQEKYNKLKELEKQKRFEFWRQIGFTF